MIVAINTSRFQVSGVRCQHLKSTHWIGVHHALDFLSSHVTFSRRSSKIQDFGLDFY